ncbi:MAG TPA: cyclase family protein [Patescibacteria group bacterium]|nr:cyclase family protein [Patescibacteria group bacterium]
MKLIDLTHTFTSDMPVYPGDPKATLEQVAFIEKDTYNDHRLTAVMHVGTHMDAPLHMIEDGKKMDEINPEKFFGNGVLIDVRGKMSIDATVLEGIEIEQGSVVLLYTGFGDKYRTDDYFKDYPELKEDFANKMVELGVKMVGMDMLGPDYDKPWTTHKILLGSDVTILENLTNLDQLEGKDFEVVALPMKLQADAAPVRVVAKIL